MARPSDAPDVYQNTVRRMEPNIHMVDEGAGWASCAISLKRIADSLAAIRLYCYLGWIAMAIGMVAGFFFK